MKTFIRLIPFIIACIIVIFGLWCFLVCGYDISLRAESTELEICYFGFGLGFGCGILGILIMVLAYFDVLVSGCKCMFEMIKNRKK